MPIDLTGPRARVSERVFRDRITIRRNPPTNAPVALDDETGLPMVDPAADVTVLAVDVPCSIRDADRLETDDGTKLVKTWSVGMDYDAAPDDLNVGDEIEVTVSEDAELLGIRMFVSRVKTGTNRVTRRVEASRGFDAIGKH
jgi:hypothetical protein